MEARLTDLLGEFVELGARVSRLHEADLRFSEQQGKTIHNLASWNRLLRKEAAAERERADKLRRHLANCHLAILAMVVAAIVAGWLR
jgi:hypothetical protein